MQMHYGILSLQSQLLDMETFTPELILEDLLFLLCVCWEFLLFQLWSSLSSIH